MSAIDAQVVFGDHPEIHLRGELDAFAVPDVSRAVAYAAGAGNPHVVIDLAGVTFCDSAGLAALVEARRRAGTITLRRPSPAVERSMQKTGLDGTFPVQR